MLHAFRAPRRLALLLLVSLLVMAPVAGLAMGASDAMQSFERFTDDRVQALRARSETARARPEVRPGPSAPVITYRAIGGEVVRELESTGVVAVPFVGTLHYTEHIYSCDDVGATRCVEVSSAPVTEVFRFRNGAWGH